MRPVHQNPGPQDDASTRLEAVLAQAWEAPGPFRTAMDLASAADLDLATLSRLFLAQTHTRPEVFLQKARGQAACACLVTGRGSRAGLASSLGFASPRAFQDAFRQQTGLTPGAYEAMLETNRFRLPLPKNSRIQDLLRFHGRDPASVTERVQDATLRKAAFFAGHPAVLSLSFGADSVGVALQGASGPQAMAEAHRGALRLLAWEGDPTAFEAAHPGLSRGREGLRVPLTLNPFEALVWAILGQQVNLAFAYGLRRDLVRLAGTPIEDLIAHPEPAHLAGLTPEDLKARRFSTRKAEYVLHAAAKVAEGQVRLDQPLSATRAEQALLALRGCGPWTAQYVLMRGLGFPDCVPIGDSALTTALQRWFKLEERPDGPATARLMAPFAPHRSLATFHFWASLRGVPA